jgi:pilus assembly protein Flp/PilA
MLIRFLNDDSGATAIEYALIAAAVGTAVAGFAGGFGENLTTLFDTIKEKTAAPQ